MPTQVPGFSFGIDDQGRLIEAGWFRYPTLMHLVWQVRLTCAKGCMQQTCLQASVGCFPTDLPVNHAAGLAGLFEAVLVKPRRI